ncbi:MAG: RNase adapter RapZ [Oscillospiraceae bacterium]|nr:RNase adapter RapZ [Oscillospiraceae bacterium]
MDILIISGLSGGGKSQAAAILEDLDFYCIDNMPVSLMPRFAEMCLASGGRYERVAFVTDVRGRESFDELFSALDEMRSMGYEHKILFLEADVETIVKRYKETRRRHPLDPEGRDITFAVNREKRMLETVRSRANYIIDTSELTIAKLQKKLHGIFADKQNELSMSVNVMSFGFKYGLPLEADVVMDVRFLPNPYYVDELREKTGLDKPVADYIFGYDVSVEFMEKFKSMLLFLLPNYIEEGKSALTVAVGCTGGRHRSVAVASRIADFLSKDGYIASCRHRDMEKVSV